MMTVLFVLLPYPSHYLATFGFARMWQDMGYRTVFAGQASQRELVEREGYIFCELEYTTNYAVWNVRIFAGLLLRSISNVNDLRRRYRFWYNSVLSYRKLLSEEVPSIVFLDDHLGHYILYQLPLQAKTVLLNTKLSTRRRINIPPLNSDSTPTNTILSKMRCWLLWENHLLKRYWWNWINNFPFLGRSNHYFQDRLVQKQKTISSVYLSNDNAFYKGIRNVPSIILAPHSFEYKQYKKFREEFFLNPPFFRQEEAYKSVEYTIHKQELQKKQRAGLTHVIYGAFGTLMVENSSNMEIFLPKLIKAVSDRADWFLLLSVPQNRFSLSLDNSPNVLIMPFAPQLDILTWTNAVVTHGGLTTVKECLQNGVPMLIYPMNKRMDMLGNAARVVSNKYGLAGQMTKDTANSISKKLAEVLNLKFAPVQTDTCLTSELMDTLHLNLPKF